MQMFRAWLFTLIALFIAAVGSFVAFRRSAWAAPAESSTKTNYFQATGLVTSIKPAEKKIEIKHDAIPGYMDAMTMTFDVPDTNEIKDVDRGDPIAFRLVIMESNGWPEHGWVDQIRKTGARTNIVPTTGSFRLVRDVEPLDVGDPLSEYHFTNEFNQPITTSQFKGQALAINFLFTRCPFPDFCPRTAKLFAETEKALANLPNGPTNWHLMTITIDPDYDTPAVLRAYGRIYNYDSNRWTFATGALIDITAIGEQFGLTFWRDETSGLPNHNLRTAVIDAKGRVLDRLDGNTWESPQLVQDMVKAARAK